MARVEGVTEMKALEFQTEVNANQTVTLPPDIVSQIPAGLPVRVFILVPEVDDEAEEDADWKRLGLEQFFKDDDPEMDALYGRNDDLSGG
jgi:hypothetical protein